MAPALEGEFPEAQLDLLNQLLQSSEFKALLLERDLRIGVCVEMEEKPGMLFTIVSIC